MPATTTALTGRNGKHSIGTNIVKRITQWSVNPTLASSSEWGDSDTAGYTARESGRRDATFSSEGKYDTTDEQFDLFAPGDKLATVLWMSSATNLYWDFPCAMNSDFSMTVNVETEEVVGWNSSWGADGIYYRPGQAGAGSHTWPPS